MKCKWKYNNNGSPDAIMLTVSTNVFLWISKLKNIIFDIYIYIYIYILNTHWINNNKFARPTAHAC